MLYCLGGEFGHCTKLQATACQATSSPQMSSESREFVSLDSRKLPAAKSHVPAESAFCCPTSHQSGALGSLFQRQTIVDWIIKRTSIGQPLPISAFSFFCPILSTNSSCTGFDACGLVLHSKLHLHLIPQKGVCAVCCAVQFSAGCPHCPHLLNGICV